MPTDPLRTAIADAIDDGIDGNAFDACAWELLHHIYPNLAPVIGGNDAGFDGAFGGPEGRWPQICTVRPDVEVNVRNSLTRYLQTNGPRRAIVATPQGLTPAKQRSIIEEAATRGVMIEQVYDRAWLINALIESPRHRLQLTGVPGDPDALALLAAGSRGRVTELLTGRDDDLKWLRNTTGDAVLVGQPGSGKTALHEQLAAEGHCRFVRDFDLGRLRDAILRYRPRCIVVDDAHLEPDMLATLRSFRTDIGGDFSIHANCWPSGLAQCRAHLRVGDGQVRELELLTQREIVQVIKATGLDGPNVLLSTILAQAIGRPGLAVVLARACLAGDDVRVWTGDVMAEFILDGRQMGPSSEERDLLGVLSLSGDWGMCVGEVATAMDEKLFTIRKRLAELATGGVLEDMGAERVRVQSAALRFLLVKRIFFDSPVALNVQRFTHLARPDDLIHGLLGARQRGAQVSLEIVRSTMAGCASAKAWEHLAHTDSECARLFLDERPDFVLSGADGLLHHHPELALKALFARCAKVARPNDHPVRSAIGAWISDDVTTSAEIVRRKTLLAVELQRWCAQAAPEQLHGIGVVAAEVLSLSYSFSEMTPGSNQFVISSGTYSEDVARGTFANWPILCRLLSHLPKSEWRLLLHAVSQLGSPVRSGLRDDPGLRKLLLSTRQEMAQDISRHPAADRAVRAWASALLSKWGCVVTTLSEDEDYCDLFIRHRWRDDWRAEEQLIEATHRQLAARLATRSAIETVADVLAMEVENASLNTNDVHHRWAFYTEMARLTPEPATWATALIDGRADALHMWPFLSRLLEEGHPSTRVLLKRCLSLPPYQASAAVRALLLVPRDEELFSMVIESDDVGMVPDAGAIAHNELSDSLRLELLSCSNPHIRAAASVSEMIRVKLEPMPSHLLAAWSAALLDCHDNDTAFWLKHMSTVVPGAAYSWLRRRIEGGDPIGLMNLSHHVPPLLASLTMDEREQLLKQIGDSSHFVEEIFEVLLAGDMALFENWYRGCTNDGVKAAAVAAGYPKTWEQRIDVALRHGAGGELLQRACSHHMIGGVSSLSEYYRHVVDFFERFASHQHPTLRRVCTEHARWAQTLVERFSREERERAVKGRW